MPQTSKRLGPVQNSVLRWGKTCRIMRKVDEPGKFTWKGDDPAAGVAGVRHAELKRWDVTL